MVHQLDPVLIEKLRGNNDVADAGFILERQEHKTFRGARPLTDNHPARHAHKSPIPQLANIDRSQRVKLLQLGAMISDRMLTDSQSSATEIRIHAFRDR